jgi:hypothetical protein
MDDQNPPSPADDARTTSPLRQSDYEAIESAVMETAKGRWFLAEFARRNRAADTEAVLAAVARLERLVRRERPGDRASERPSETERMHLDLAEIRDVINRNTSGLGAPVAESPSAPSDPGPAAIDDPAADVDAKSPALSEAHADLALGGALPARADIHSATDDIHSVTDDVRPASDDVLPDDVLTAPDDVHAARSVVAVGGASESEETGEIADEGISAGAEVDIAASADGISTSADGAASTGTITTHAAIATAATTQAARIGADTTGADTSQAATTQAVTGGAFGDIPSPLPGDAPAAFIETPLPDDFSDEQSDELGDMADETEALARANAAIDDAIETLRGVSGAVTAPPPGRLPDPRIDPIASLPRTERLALFS